MLKLLSHATTYNLLTRLYEAFLIKFHLVETLMVIMTISPGSVDCLTLLHAAAQMEGHLPRIWEPAV